VRPFRMWTDGRRYETVLRLGEALSLCQELEDLTKILSGQLHEFLDFFQFYTVVYYHSRFWQIASIPLDEGADPGDGFAENQVLHLECSLGCREVIRRRTICPDPTSRIAGLDLIQPSRRL
jgi:hypothetical protein